jgi:hypothetical protein
MQVRDLSQRRSAVLNAPAEAATHPESRGPIPPIPFREFSDTIPNPFRHFRYRH